MPAELEAVDVLLDDPRFFEPFRRWFDPAVGRPSIPMESYLRLMFLKYRYRLGYESLCAEVSDSLTWLRFCRIPLGERAPHPSTLMKITTRCGPATVDVTQRRSDRRRGRSRGDRHGLAACRHDRCAGGHQVPDRLWFVDQGHHSYRLRWSAGLQAAGIAPRTAFDRSDTAARQGAHRIGSKLRRRTDDAKAEVLAITGELADLAETAVEQARRVLVNAQRMGERPVRRLRRMLADLAHLLDAVTQVIRPDPAASDRRDPGRPRPVECRCTTTMPARSARAASPRRPSSVTPARSPTTATGSLSTTNSKPGCHPTRPVSHPRSPESDHRHRVVPDAVTADRGYGQTSVDTDLAELGVDLVAILRKGQPGNARQQAETADRLRRTRQMAHRSRGPHRRVETPTRLGTSPTPWARRRPRSGAAGAVLSHNAIKIAALTN